MDKQIIVLITVVAIVVLSGIQLVQINNIKDAFVVKGSIGGGNVIQSSVQGIAALPQTPPAPTPSMVGGC